MLFAALGACQSMRTREFAASKSGAAAAIKVLLKQPQNGSIDFTLKKEPVEAPSREWTDQNYVRAYDTVTGVVVIEHGQDASSAQRSWTFVGSREGLAEARAFATEGSSSRGVMVRLERGTDHLGDPYAWGWYGASPASVAPFDEGVCLEFDCVDYSQVRAIWAVTAEWQSGPFPATRAGVLAAMSDPVAMMRNGRVIVEAPQPMDRVWRPVHFSTVSVLEDDRICGQAAQIPLAVTERCYAYSNIEGFEVRDRTVTLADAVSDTVTFPFRLVGAVTMATVMGAAN
jgi:hypothetical protein